MTLAALCGRSPVRIRAVSRPYGPQTGRERNVCLGPSDGKGEPLMQHSCARALLIGRLMCRQGPILRHPGRSATGNRPQCGAQAPSQNDRGQHFRCRPESPTLRIFTRRLLHQLHPDESYPCIENFCARPTASCFFAPRKIVLMMSKMIMCV